MKRVLLTGGSGFVGANLARRLLHDGHELHLVLRPEHQSWRLDGLTGHAAQYAASLDDAEAVRRVVEAVRPDWVFHLAAHGAYSWQRDAGTIFRVNTLGTVTLLDACAVAGFEAFVQAGSSSEYGLKDHAPAETEALDPNSAYAVSKAAATMYGRQVALSRRLPITTLRLYSAYGPYEDAKRLMPTVVREGLAHRLPALADAMIARDYVHVDDVCDAFILAAEAKPRRSGAIYNVGTGVQTTLREVVELVRSKLGITALPEWNSMPARDWDTVTWQSDPRLIREELGWVAQRDLSRGLDEFIAWTRDHPGVTGHSRS